MAENPKNGEIEREKNNQNEMVIFDHSDHCLLIQWKQTTPTRQEDFRYSLLVLKRRVVSGLQRDAKLTNR